MEGKWRMECSIIVNKKQDSFISPVIIYRLSKDEGLRRNTVEAPRSIATVQKSWSHLQANLQTLVINFTVGMCYVLATMINQTYFRNDPGSSIPKVPSKKVLTIKKRMKETDRVTFVSTICPGKCNHSCTRVQQWSCAGRTNKNSKEQC